MVAHAPTASIVSAIPKPQIQPPSSVASATSPGVAFGSSEAIAAAANRLDHSRFAVRFERQAQAANMHVDGPLLDIDMVAPDLIEQLRARMDALRPRHQKAKQPEFSRSEVDISIPRQELANWAKNKYPACMSLSAQRAERSGRIGPSSVITIPTSTKSRWAKTVPLVAGFSGSAVPRELF